MRTFGGLKSCLCSIHPPLTGCEIFYLQLFFRYVE
jgi:hypothetical protein